MRIEPSALLLNGTVGAGKTSVGAAVCRLLDDTGLSYAIVDLDDIRRRWPPPPDDPFDLALELRNLKAVARNYLDVGIRRLVLAGVVERKDDLPRYRAAVGLELTTVRLRAELNEVHRRLRIRHANDEWARKWHIERSGNLDRILDQAGVSDFEVSTDGRPLEEIAAEVLERAGWPPSSM